MEPLVSLQWFCDMTRLAEPAIAAVEQGRVRFTPPKWGEVYLDWMREIRPWCVSRQLWWGHQLPVWYRGDEVYVGPEAPEGEGWVRDQDVLDTWFSSALWPFATLGWPERTPELARFYPTQVLSTARDIIFLWVARMVMMGVEYTGAEPFSTSTSTRWCRRRRPAHEQVARHRHRPHRADRPARRRRPALRPADDVEHPGRALQPRPHRPGPPARHQALERRPPGGRPRRPGRARHRAAHTLADRWIASRITAAINQSQTLIAGFQLSQLADLVYHLVFDDYCDWYLELLKAGEATPEMAGHALEQLLALAHPLMPFVTEVLVAHARRAGSWPPTPPRSRPDRATRRPRPRSRPSGGGQRPCAGTGSSRGTPPRTALVVRRRTPPVPLSHAPSPAAPPRPCRALCRHMLADGRSILVGPPPRTSIPPSSARDLAERAGDGGGGRSRRRPSAKLADTRFVERAPADLVEAEREKVTGSRPKRPRGLAERIATP